MGDRKNNNEQDFKVPVWFHVADEEWRKIQKSEIKPDENNRDFIIGGSIANFIKGTGRE